MTLPPVKILRPHKRGKADIPAGIRPRLDTGNEAETLSGQVNGMKASMPEERMARALSKFGASFEFRYIVGAPVRGLPGYKEIDFVVPAGGLVYAFEVDTVWTHREKGRADVLHDAIVLQELQQQGMSVYPTVLHVDGETDLVDHKSAERYVKSKLPLTSGFYVNPVQTEEEYITPVKVNTPPPTTLAQVEQQAMQPLPKKEFQELSGYRQKIVSRKRKNAGLKEL